MLTENAINLLSGLADLLEETEEAMVVRSTVRASIRSALSAIRGGGGAQPQYLTPMPSSTSPIKLIIEGNSMSVGLHTGLATLLTAEYGADRFDIASVATSGQATPQMVTDFASQVGSVSVDNATFATIWTLVNDFYLSSISARDAVDDLWEWCDLAVAAGIRPIVITPTPRSNESTPSDYESRRQTALGLIRAEWRDHCSAVLDLAADARIGDAGDEENATYYSDLVHMTAAGYAIVQQGIKKCIDALLAGSPDGKPLFDVQPDSFSGYVDDTVSLTAYAVSEGVNGCAFQWQKSTDDGTTWTNVSDATANILSFTATIDDDGDQYRCVATSRQGSTNSDAATITVSEPATGPSEIASVLGVWEASSGAFEERTSPTTVPSNGDPVGTWQSSVGSAAFTAPTDAKRFSFVESQINGLPILRSDGTDDVMTLSASLNARTICVVAKHPSATLLQNLPGLLTSNANGSIGLSLEGEEIGGTFFQDAQIGSSTIMRRNGVETTLSSTAASNELAIPGNEFVCFILRSSTARNFVWQLAAGRAAGRFGQWDIAHVSIFEDSLTSEELAIVEDYIAATFGIVF